jgi:hypothetical protein
METVAFPELSSEFERSENDRFQKELDQASREATSFATLPGIQFGPLMSTEYLPRLNELKIKLERFLETWEGYFRESDYDLDLLGRDIKDILPRLSSLASIRVCSFASSPGSSSPVSTKKYLDDHVLSVLSAIRHDITDIVERLGQYQRSTYAKCPRAFFEKCTFPLDKLKGIAGTSPVRIAFDRLTDAHLSAPFMTVLGSKRIGCCLPCIQNTIGPLVPSLYGRRAFPVRILSFVEREFQLKLTMAQGETFFSCAPVVAPLQAITIWTSLPPSHLQDLQVVEYEGKLDISSTGLSPLSLPVKFIFRLFPLRVVISAHNFCLTYFNEIFHVQKPLFVPGDTLRIDFSVPHGPPELRSEVWTTSHEDNESTEPMCSFVNNALMIIIPHESKRIHGIVSVRLSSHLDLSFEINGIIQSFDFSVMGYDQGKDQLCSDCLTIVSAPNYSQCIKFHVWMTQTRAKKDISFETAPSQSAGSQFRVPDFRHGDEFDFELQLTTPDQDLPLSRFEFIVRISGVSHPFVIRLAEYARVTVAKEGWGFTNSFLFTESDIPHYCRKIDSTKWDRVDKSAGSATEYVLPRLPIVFIIPFEIFVVSSPKTNTGVRLCFENDRSMLPPVVRPSVSDSSKHLGYWCLTIQTSRWTSSSVVLQKTNAIPTDDSASAVLAGFWTEKKRSSWWPLFKSFEEPFELLNVQPGSIARASRQLIAFVATILKGHELPPTQNIQGMASHIIQNGSLFERTNFAFVVALLCSGPQLSQSSIEPLSKRMKLAFYDSGYFSVKDTNVVVIHNTVMALYRALTERFRKLSQRHFYLFLKTDWENLIQVQQGYFHPFDDERRRSTYQAACRRQAAVFSRSSLMAESVIDAGTEYMRKSEIWEIGEGEEPHPAPPHRADPPQRGSLRGIIQEPNVKSLDLDVEAALTLPDFAKISSIIDLQRYLNVLTNISHSIPFFLKVIREKRGNFRTVQSVFTVLSKTYLALQDAKETFLGPVVAIFLHSFERLCALLVRSKIRLEGFPPEFSRKVEAMETGREFVEEAELAHFPAPTSRWVSHGTLEWSGISRSIAGGEVEYQDDLDLSLPPPVDLETKPPVEVNAGPRSQVKVVKGAEMIFVSSDVTVSGLDDHLPGVDLKRKEGHAISGAIDDELEVHPIEDDTLERVRQGFTGQDMIASVVARIRLLTAQGHLFLPRESTAKPLAPHLLTYHTPMHSGVKMPIDILLDFGQRLSVGLFQAGVDSGCCLENTSGIIAVECSQTLAPQSKIACVILAIALANAFAMLEVPYSVMVFADFNFQFVIKSFQDPHSPKVLQRVLDAVMVERFPQKIADACQFAKSIPRCPPRTNRAFIIISDGLDPNLHHIDDWKKYILADRNDGFVFYFLKSAYLSGDSLAIVERFLKGFIDGIATAISPAQGIVFTADLILSGAQVLRDSFRRVLSGLQTVGEPVEHSFIQPLCEEPKCEITKVIERFASLFDSTFSASTDQIYWKSTDDIDRSIDVRIPAVQIDSSFVPKLKLPEMIRDFKQRLLLGCPLVESQWNEAIFAPNRPSQMAPSTKGSMLYMPGLIKFCLTDGQENKIWLEKIAGLKRSYRVTIVVDSSYSCFNDLMIVHSVQTLLGFLRLLSRIDVPYFDLIIATTGAPRILTVNQSSAHAIDFQSFQLLAALFGSLMENGVSSNMVDAMKVAMKVKSLASAQRSYLFVFTDGLFGESQRQELKNLFRLCRDNMIEVFGVGIGRYPARAFELFSKVVWALHPTHLVTALSCFFGNESIPPAKRIDLFTFETPNLAGFGSLVQDITEKWNDRCCYKDLYKHLRDQTLYQQSMPDFQPEDLGLSGGRATNPVFIPEKAMYAAGAFAGQKILVCCFWSKVLAETVESEFIDPKYLTQRPPHTSHCVQDVLNHYGIKLEIVQNYKDGILRMQTGEHYAIWVICGGGTGKLPDGGNPHLVQQFFGCVETYWKSGGAVVWWCDKSLDFECNQWLKIATFPNVVGPLGLEITKGCDGGKRLIRGNTNAVKRQVFSDQDRIDFQYYYRPTLAHNLASIFEGLTIAKVKPGSNLGPFLPFSYDSEGGISSLFYLSDFESKRGDVIIDCGFTKLFTELTEDGTLRYVQNIAALTGQYEKSMRLTGAENGAKTVRPVSFAYPIDETVRADKLFVQSETSGPFDVVYLCDATGSMSSYIEAAKKECVSISEQLRRTLPQFQFQFGAVFYRDPVDSPSDVHDTFLLTNRPENLQAEIGRVRASGGGDGPEDWVGAYHRAVNNMSWRGGQKLIIHLADAPAHGRDFCGQNNHNPEGPKLVPLIQQCAQQRIKIVGMPIGGSADTQLSFNKCQQLYTPGAPKGALYKIQPFGTGKDIPALFKSSVIEAIICAAPRASK